MRIRKRSLVWLVSLSLYAIFWLWYTPLSGPMTEEEVESIVAGLEAEGATPERVELFRRFFAEDDGRSFLMVNLIDAKDTPIELPATGPDASADQLLGHYMEYMYPALFSRASHPVFVGRAVNDSMDLVGIEGAEQWQIAALMRYRSRRDLWEISSHPSFDERHAYKIAALEKTIAFPVRPQVFLGDPRLILFLAVVILLSLLDNWVLSKELKSIIKATRFGGLSQVKNS